MFCVSKNVERRVTQASSNIEHAHPLPPFHPPLPPPPRPQLEIAHKSRYHGGAKSSGVGGGGGTANGSLGRPQSPRAIGTVTLGEAKAQLGPGFSILRERPCVARAVAAPEQALSALRECTRETDRGIGDAFHLRG